MPTLSHSGKLVQMTLQPETMEQIETIQQLSGVTNRTQIVTASIELTEEILKVLQDGGKVYYEHKDGKREVLEFVGKF